MRLGELLTKIMKSIFSNTSPVAAETSSLLPDIAASDERLYRAWTYMKDNHQKKITADKVAAIVGMSTSRFLHLFNEQMHFSFSNTLIRIRLEAAQRMRMFLSAQSPNYAVFPTIAA